MLEIRNVGIPEYWKFEISVFKTKKYLKFRMSNSKMLDFKTSELQPLKRTIPVQTIFNIYLPLFIVAVFKSH